MSREVRAALETLLAHFGTKEDEQSTLTIDELWEMYWLAEGRHRKSGKSGIRSRWKALKAFFGGMKIGAITRTVVEKFRDARSSQDTRRGRPPAIGTVNREIAALRRMLNWAAEQDPPLLTRNPIARFEFQDEDSVRQSKISTEEDLSFLLECCSPLIEALVLCLIDSGMRRMEVMKLRWDQIDLSTRRVLLVGHKTKTKRARRPRLSVRAMAAVLELPRICDWVFANPKTKKAYGPRHLYRLYEKSVLDSGLVGVEGEKIVLHTLKHSFIYKARVLWKQPERTTMAMTGNTTRSCFDRYGIVDDEEEDRAYDEIDMNIERALTELRASKRKGPQRASAPVDAQSVEVPKN